MDPKVIRDIAVSVIAAFVFALLVKFWSRIDRTLRGGKHKVLRPEEALPKTLGWGPEDIACRFPASNLTGAFQVDPGAQLAVVDRGEVQEFLDEGIHTALKTEATLGNSAVALLYRRGPVPFHLQLQGLRSADPFLDVTVTVEGSIAVDKDLLTNFSTQIAKENRCVPAAEGRRVLQEAIHPAARAYLLATQLEDAIAAPELLRGKIAGPFDLAAKTSGLKATFENTQIASHLHSTILRAMEDAQFKEKLAKATTQGVLAEEQQKVVRENTIRLLQHQGKMEEMKLRAQRGEFVDWMRDEMGPEIEFFPKQEQQFRDKAEKAGFGPYLDCVNRLRSQGSPFRLELWRSEAERPRTRNITGMASHTAEGLTDGDKFEFLLRSAKPGYICLLNLGTTGAATLLYPNGWSKSWNPEGRLAAETDFMMPDDKRYVFGKQEGTLEGVEIVQALVTSQPLDMILGLRMPADRCFGWSEAATPGILADLAAQLGRLPEGSWGESAISFFAGTRAARV